MQIKTHQHFDKAWSKQTSKNKKAVLASIELLINNPTSPKIRLHQLKGQLYPQYSISAGEDLRIHFLQSELDTIVLMAIGTHYQLYK